jgi:hypothetical protein
MDEPHLVAAARYVPLDPVVAGLVSRAEDWPGSSTRTQLAGEDDELITVAPSQALIPDFAALLAIPTDAATTTRIERALTIGRPPGRPEWIEMLERRLGRLWYQASPAQSREWSGTPLGKRSYCESTVNCHRNPDTVIPNAVSKLQLSDSCSVRDKSSKPTTPLAASQELGAK